MPLWQRAAHLVDPSAAKNGRCFQARPLQVDLLPGRGQPVDTALAQEIGERQSFMVRARAGVTPGDRIRFRGQDWEVESAANAPPRGRRSLVTCRRVQLSRLVEPITIGGEPLVIAGDTVEVCN